MPGSIHPLHASSTEPLLSSAHRLLYPVLADHTCAITRECPGYRKPGVGGGAEEMSAGGPWGWKEDVKDSACDTRLRRERWKPGLEGGNRRKGEPGRGGAHAKAGWHEEEGDDKCGGRRCPGGGAEAEEVGLDQEGPRMPGLWQVFSAVGALCTGQAV